MSWGSALYSLCKEFNMDKHQNNKPFLQSQHIPNTIRKGSGDAVKEHGSGGVPAGIRARFEASLCIGLPHAVGLLIANGRHDLDELERPLVQVQRAHPGQVGAEVTMDAWALDTDEGAQVEARPIWVWR